MKTIYCFINDTLERGLLNVAAVCECGDYVAGHVSSNTAFAQHDIGITSNWHQAQYSEHCQEQHGNDGYTLVWVDDPTRHTALCAIRDQQQQQPVSEPLRPETESAKPTTTKKK